MTATKSAKRAPPEVQPAPDVAGAAEQDEKESAMNDPQVSTRGATALRDALAGKLDSLYVWASGLRGEAPEVRGQAMETIRLAAEALRASQLSLSPPTEPTAVEVSALLDESKAPSKLNLSPRVARTGANAKAWWYENENSIDVFAQHHTGGTTYCRISRHQIESWLRKLAPKSAKRATKGRASNV